MCYRQYIVKYGDKKLTLKFSILQLSLWSTWCSFLSFAAMYFVKSGYSYTFAGVALSVAISCGIAGQIFWGFLCDKIQSIKKVYIMANIILLISIFTLFRIMSPLHILIAIGCVGFCQTPLPAVLDSWILNKNVENQLNYGFIRMWAAIGFSFFGWIIGLGIEKSGYWVMFAFAAVFVVCTVVVSLLTADAAETGAILKHRNNSHSYVQLFKNKKYLLFLIACFLIGLGNQVSDNLRPLIVSDVGGNSGDLGMVLFLAAVTELPFFFYSSKIFSRFNARQLFIFSGCAYGIHFLLVAVARSIAAVAIGMMFQGVAFSVLLPNMRIFAYDNVPEELRTSGQTLTDALFAGLAGVIASAFGAVIIEYTSVMTLYSICIVFAAVAVGILLSISKKEEKQVQDISPKP